MKVIRISAFLLLLVSLTFSQEKTVPVAEEPDHQLVLENEYTRVFHVVLPPGNSTLMHQHDRDYVYVMIGPSQIEMTKAGAAPAQMKLNDGDVRFTKGPLTHKVTNIGGTPFVNVTIEVKKPSTKSVCGASWPGVQVEKPQMCEITMSGFFGETSNLKTDEVEATTEFTTGSGTGVKPGNIDKARLLVALSQLACLCADRKVLRMNPGDVAWLPPRTPEQVWNVRDIHARFVIVSFE